MAERRKYNLRGFTLNYYVGTSWKKAKIIVTLSGNHIQHIDSTMLAATLKLMTLSLANNRLTILPDNVFMGLGSLLRLDLSANPIRHGETKRRMH